MTCLYNDKARANLKNVFVGCERKGSYWINDRDLRSKGVKRRANFTSFCQKRASELNSNLSYITVFKISTVCQTASNVDHFQRQFYKPKTMQ